MGDKPTKNKVMQVAEKRSDFSGTALSFGGSGGVGGGGGGGDAAPFLDAWGKIGSDLEPRVHDLEKRLEDALTKYAVLKDDLEKTKQKADETGLKFFEALAIFVALFTFASFSFKLFDSATYQELVSAVLLISGMLIVFCLIIDLLISGWTNKPQGWALLRFIFLFGIAACLITTGLNEVKKVPEEDLKQEQNTQLLIQSPIVTTEQTSQENTQQGNSNK